MSEYKSGSIIPSKGGFFQDLLLRLKLIMRLMGDARISPFLKLVTIGALVYLVVPLDLAIGPVDDAAVIGLAMYLFVELCPPEVVQEHMIALGGALPEKQPSKPEEEIIEGEFHEE
jgi:uncharacterized membrane protein YkvA (DUF1232 family)